jgi:hypothetical protein
VTVGISVRWSAVRELTSTTFTIMLKSCDSVHGLLWPCMRLSRHRVAWLAYQASLRQPVPVMWVACEWHHAAGK